jgi:nucleoid-associated protein YgaU
VPAALQVLGQALAAWLIAGTLLSLARRAVPALRGWEALDAITLPAIRQALDRVAAVSMAVAVVTPNVDAIRAGRAGGESVVVRTTVEPSSTTAASRADDVVVRRVPREAEAPTRVDPPQPPPAPRHHVVIPGDNLWAIARGVLLETGAPPSDLRDATVARYWLKLIAVNRATLRSGDPNLIFPGEVVELPVV